MPIAKEQMNVLISKETVDKARQCATVQHTSLNQWVQKALEAQAEQDYETYQIEKMAKDLSKIARRYLPSQPVSPEKMLAMAKVFAKEDTEDGLETRYVPEAAPQLEKPRRPRTTRSRKK